ncbi:hypothetical protein D3C83_280120 [compost metagenome]
MNGGGTTSARFLRAIVSSTSMCVAASPESAIANSSASRSKRREIAFSIGSETNVSAQ